MRVQGAAHLRAVASVFSLSSSLSRDLLSNKDPEIRSIFQLVQAAQLRRSPSELFAQHIVSVLHYIKGTSVASPAFSSPGVVS